jgi:hypothetical protein
MAVTLQPDGRSARYIPNSTILRGQSSAGSIIPPLQLFRSPSGRRSWRAFRERSPIPPSSTLFEMRRSCEGEEPSSAYARQLVSTPKSRGKAIKRENMKVDILTFNGFFDSESDILKPR